MEAWDGIFVDRMGGGGFGESFHLTQDSRPTKLDLILQAASPSVPVCLCRLLPLLDDDGHRSGRWEHGRGGGGGHDGGGSLDGDDLGLGLGLGLSHELRGLGYEWGWLGDQLRLLE